MNYQYIINEYLEYQKTNKWKEVFMVKNTFKQILDMLEYLIVFFLKQNAKFDSETLNYTCSHARHPINSKYNRYRDILPCDY